MMRMIRVIALCVLVALASAEKERDKFYLYSPECAAKRVSQPIHYSLSNFGTIPYGETIIGQIHLPSSDDELCNIQGEKPISTFDKDETTIKNILLIKRGTCKFVQKVMNAQKLGADIAIIYDDEGDDQIRVIMKNDGHGHLVEIPSLFISHFHGQKLRATTNDCPSLPVIKIPFAIDKWQKAEVTFWLDSNHRESYILIRDFLNNNYYQVLKDRMDFSVGYRIETHCRLTNLCAKEDCVGTNSNKFCRNVKKPQTKDQQYAKGVDIIHEQLREHFLLEELKMLQDEKKWWQYMSAFDESYCLGREDVKDCAGTVMRQVGITEHVVNEVNKKVDETVQKVANQMPNKLLEDSVNAKENGIYFYPEATVNLRNFYGLFKAPQVFEMICDSLLEPPKECLTFVKTDPVVNIQDKTNVWFTIFIVVTAMTTGFLIGLYIYTKVVRKEVDQQLSVEVNKMVENYVNLTQKSNTSTNYAKMDD